MEAVLNDNLLQKLAPIAQDNPEEVVELLLPGKINFKLASVGSALLQFSGLKILDLSRNVIKSLKGLEGLVSLEVLNLYYNQVYSLAELLRLRYNTSLQNIDLRLNPVIRRDPDYPIYLIHLLPKLRVLDDRAVGQVERKLALLYFSTDEAARMTVHFPPSDTKVSSQTPKRTASSRSVAQASQSKCFTGDGGGDSAERKCKRKPTLPPSLPPNEFTSLYPNLASILVHDQAEPSTNDELVTKSHLRFQDESDAYTSYKSVGFFTSNPNLTTCRNSQK